MGKRVTKNDLALQELRNKRDEAKWKVNEADTILKMAHAVYMAYSDAYDKMSASLAPKPRSNGSAAKPKRASKGGMAKALNDSLESQKRVTENASAEKTPCSQCGEADDHSNHDAGYLSSHPFLPSSPAPSVKKRSSSVSAPKTDGDQNILVNDKNVSSVDS